MKKHLKFEAWAKPKLKKYLEVLCLQGYSQEGFEFDKDTSYLKIGTNYPYRGFLINYGPGAIVAFENKDYAQLKFALLHECIHLVLAELAAKAHDRSTRKEVEDSLESTTDHLTVVLNRYVQ